MLAEALSHVAHAAIRNRGTIGGSIVHADPSAELPTLLVALDGSVKIAGSAGMRTLAPGDLFLAELATAVAPNELVVEVSFPVLPPAAGWPTGGGGRRLNVKNFAQPLLSVFPS